ncbi:hypothetical protein PMI36_03318 [Pseudomonas sp. GM79]|nr:hypothetical protein PMI36_03318 [Pseudomonas sp. GM79]
MTDVMSWLDLCKHMKLGKCVSLFLVVEFPLCFIQMEVGCKLQMSVITGSVYKRCVC